MMTSGIGQQLQTANSQPPQFGCLSRKMAPKFGEMGATKGHWTQEEDEILQEAVTENGGKNWKKISESLPGRTDV